jgi:hypothetical protein
MFDLRDALSGFDGKSVDFDQLQGILRQIRREHIAEISPEIGEREFLGLAQTRDWIVEDENGNFRINVMQSV